MVTYAPAWGIDAGWDQLNSSSTSILNASLEGLKHTAGYTSTHPGYAYILGMVSIIILVYLVIYLRTQKTYAAFAGCLLILLIYIYFNLLDVVYLMGIFGVMVLLTALEWAYSWWNSD
jgi:hypothetical protein